VADLPFDYPDITPPNAGASSRKCRRHSWIAEMAWTHGDSGEHDYRPTGQVRCLRCSAVRDDKAARRGRNNRSRGNSIEREIGKRLGLRRVGQYGGPDDLSGELFAAQVKSGGAFSERLWSWLKAVPVNAGQTALLVVTDAPGPGHRRRAMVILDIGDWEALHAGTPEAP
jgi:hypothetical protein